MRKYTCWHDQGVTIGVGTLSRRDELQLNVCRFAPFVDSSLARLARLLARASTSVFLAPSVAPPLASELTSLDVGPRSVSCVTARHWLRRLRNRKRRRPRSWPRRRRHEP